MTGPIEPVVVKFCPVCKAANQPLYEYTGTNFTNCQQCGQSLVVLGKPQQVTMDAILLQTLAESKEALAENKVVLQATTDELRRARQAFTRGQGTTAFYQERTSTATHRAEAAEEAFLALKSNLIIQAQSVIWRKQQGLFSSLRRPIYECFRDHVFPAWEPLKSCVHHHKLNEPCKRCTAGVFWEVGYLHARDEAKHPWAKGLDGVTYRKRLNELADVRLFQPRLLKWTKAGYYVLNDMAAEVIQEKA